MNEDGSNKEPIRILILEDSPADAELMSRQLRVAGLEFAITRVQTKEAFLDELLNVPCLILADYSLPGFDGMTALALVRQMCPDTPFILVSGAIGEERAVEALKMGATDCVLKDKLGRLGHAVRRALDECQERARLREAEAKLRAYHERLEWMVQLRTAELEKTNRKLEREIAERKKIEQALQLERDQLTSILDSMEDGVCIMDPDFSVQYANPALQAQFGSVEGQKCYQYFNGRRDTCPWCNNAEVLQGKTLRRDSQSSKTGRFYEIVDTPVRNSHGSFSKLALFHDVTERKKVEQLKDEFLGMVSHELKTPLTVIMGALGTAADKRVPAKEVRELVGDAVVHTEIMANLVENLLELSRQQSGRITLLTQPTDVAAITRSVLRKLRNKSGIHCLIDHVPTGLPPALADPLRVERILYNLVDNAIKYSPDGGEVTVSAHLQGDSLEVRVTDQGPGISRDDQARLFQSFERLGVPVKGSIQGTGLGLRVCRILAEAHGGRVWVESEKGKGSTFLFTLPLVKPYWPSR